MNDLEIYTALPEQERDRLGFRQWKQDTHQGSHYIGCWQSGPEHWHCALQEIERLQAAIVLRDQCIANEIVLRAAT